jgi:hypothetical protein
VCHGVSYREGLCDGFTMMAHAIVVLDGGGTGGNFPVWRVWEPLPDYVKNKRGGGGGGRASPSDMSNVQYVYCVCMAILYIC